MHVGLRGVYVCLCVCLCVYIWGGLNSLPAPFEDVESALLMFSLQHDSTVMSPPAGEMEKRV